MNQRIIYPNDKGGVSILIPTGELAIEEVARKDVPNGMPYKIVSLDTLPPDMTFFDAWEADFSSPDGVGIGSDAWFAEQAAKAQESEATE
jgi:hypothetical protein